MRPALPCAFRPVPQSGHGAGSPRHLDIKLRLVWRCGVTCFFPRFHSRCRSRCRQRARSLEELALSCDNSFVKDLPSDGVPVSTVPVPREVFGAAYSRVGPRAAEQPSTVAVAHEVAHLLDLDVAESERPLFAEVFSGSTVLPGFDPVATAYAGHQFGTFAGQLGDGRAMTLGEVLGRQEDAEELDTRWEIQLKGAGRTPYSRQADGKALMRSSVREFLASEALHHLGVPSTRALSLVATGEQILRQELRAPEPGAVVCRVAPSFIRFGHFELFESRDDYDLLRALATHTLQRHFPNIHAEPLTFGEKIAKMLRRTCQQTAFLIAEWERIGFVHGVMNTDNMSMCGLTIDYGPFGFMDRLDPDWTPNQTDGLRKRYCFKRQPAVALWNLQRLADSLRPLSSDLDEALEVFAPSHDFFSSRVRRQKLGLRTWDAEASSIWEDLQRCMVDARADFTLFFRQLAAVSIEDPEDVTDAQLLEPLGESFYTRPGSVQYDLAKDLRRLSQRVRRERYADRMDEMRLANPRLVPRNWILDQAAEMAQCGEGELVLELLEAFRHPYAERKVPSIWEGRPPGTGDNSQLS